jgi:hypothetical protein
MSNPSSNTKISRLTAIKNKLKDLLSYVFLLFWPSVFVVVMALLAVYLFVLLSPFMFRGRTIDWMDRHRNISFAIFMVLGIALYLLRSWVLLAYGAIEIVGGVALGWNTLRSGVFTDGFVVWTASMASTYLLVRGLDNVRQGLTVFKDVLTPKFYAVSLESMEDALRQAANDAFKAYVYWKAGLPLDLTLYSLRHSCATLLLQAGTHPRVVAERLGHSSTTLTMDVYRHVIPSMQSDATAQLEKMLYG